MAPGDPFDGPQIQQGMGEELRIVDPARQIDGCLDVSRYPVEIAQDEQLVAQLEAQVDFGPDRVDGLVTAQGVEGAQVVLDRIAMGRVRRGTTAGLDAIAIGLRPDAAPRRMHGERVEMFGQPFFVNALDGVDNADVELATPLGQQAA